MTTSDEYILSLDAFVRSFAINRGSPYALFIGAGASISSGVLSAQQCVWEWKRAIFLSRNPGLEKQFSELSLEGVRKRIQQWLDDTNAHPPRDDPSEYSHYIAQCYPIEDDRRRYFQEKVRGIRPHVGYRLLCFLAELGIVKSVWTTNFDGLVAKAATDASVQPIEVGIDCAQARLPRAPRDGELLCVSLHGDYRYDPLANTGAELQAQDVHLGRALVDELKDTSCICIGYSGRDTSVMEALTMAFSQEGAGALYWCTYGDAEPPKGVQDLIAHARQSGRQAYLVRAGSFDDLMVRLARHTAKDTERDSISGILTEYTAEQRLGRSAFSLPEYPAGTVIKGNAFDLECPKEVYAFNLKKWPEEHVWQWLQEQTEGRVMAAVPLRGQVLALGLIDDIHAAFGETIEGEIQRTPVQDHDYTYEDGAMISLMTAALAKGFAHEAGACTDGRRRLWQRKPNGNGGTRDPEVRVFDAIDLSIRRINNQVCLTLMPTLHLETPDGTPPERDVIQRVRFYKLGGQYNSEFNDAVNRWRNTLVGKGLSKKEVEFPPGVASTFRFRISQSPIFAEIGERGRKQPVTPKNVPRRLLQQYGIRVTEPELLFSGREGGGLRGDTHPLRGLLHNRPYDFSLTERGLDQAVRLGVICPEREQQQLHEYLHQVQRPQRKRAKDVYLLDFPGFQQAYGLPLEIPEPGSAGWHCCPEPTGNTQEECAVNLAHAINTAAKQIQAASAPDVVFVYVPDRWKWYRDYRNDSERFDLHDFVKAFCVQRGLATQFLNEDTLQDPDQARVWWWLSLAMYVKSMRTPWILDGIDDDAAFVGIGYSLDQARERGHHVVLGCSHIYSASGQGLQYRLSKVEQPTIVRGNPFMSEDDARRLGETIRHLFYESRSSLPRRVVLHKRTPFRRKEREGLAQGLAGVEEIDMLEVYVDRAMRYIASHVNDGNVQVDRYPVRRGTTVKIDNYAALTWVHGVTEAVLPNRKHYQGGRRIPTPLMLRRHSGHTDLEKLAFEVMGLSKMNWNTFDMYTRLPATLQSSSEIAKIGSLLERFGAGSYDYRLFM